MNHPMMSHVLWPEFEQAARSLGVEPEDLVGRFICAFPTCLSLLRRARRARDADEKLQGRHEREWHRAYISGEGDEMMLLLNLRSIDPVEPAKAPATGAAYVRSARPGEALTQDLSSGEAAP